jgi:hypothetical protein
MRNCIIIVVARGGLAATTKLIIDLVAARGGWPPRDLRTTPHELHYCVPRMGEIMRFRIISAKLHR